MTQTIEPPDANPRWTTAAPPAQPPRPDETPLERFLGGSPAAVVTRLFFISLIVGALLMWLDIRPWDIINAVERLFQRLWNLGFDAIREIAEYVLAGAILVVPVWFAARLMNQRRVN